MSDFIGEDGWPCEFAMSPIGVKLIQAIRAIPGAEALAEDNVEDKASMLFNVYEGARDEELPRCRPASQKASESELRKLSALAEKLECHIQSMRQPAVKAFHSETPRSGHDLFQLVSILQAMQENARFALSALDVEGTPSGAPKKIKAADVAFLSFGLFEDISGRRATFTSDPETSKVSGAWPDFLSAVFDALLIDASVHAQVRAVSEKSSKN